jgi:hypothetical protein
MPRIANRANRPSVPYHASRVVPGPFERIVNIVRDRLMPTVYVDGCDIPDEPESPYRARLTLPVEHSPEGVEIRERDVVRGKLRIIYEVRCSCGKRWFNPRLEAVQLCPRCSRAVLLQTPDGSVPPKSDS